MNSKTLGPDGPPSVVTYRIADQIFVDYEASTGLALRQLPRELREPGLGHGHVNTAAYAFGTPSLAINPAAWWMGTRSQLGDQLGWTDRQTTRYFSAGSMDWVAQHGNLCAAPLRAIVQYRAEIAENRHAPETKRANSASTSRDATGRFLK